MSATAETCVYCRRLCRQSSLGLCFAVMYGFLCRSQWATWVLESGAGSSLALWHCCTRFSCYCSGLGAALASHLSLKIATNRWKSVLHARLMLKSRLTNIKRVNTWVNTRTGLMDPWKLWLGTRFRLMSPLSSKHGKNYNQTFFFITYRVLHIKI